MMFFFLFSTFLFLSYFFFNFGCNFNFIEEKKKLELTEKIQHFANSKLFDALSNKFINLIYYDSKLITTTRNTIIFKQNDHGEDLYLIKKGEFKVFYFYILI